MSRSSFVKLAVLLTMFSALAIAQTDAPATPTKESIARLQGLSYGYMRLVVRALAWKAPATKACTEMRAWVESMAQPTSFPGQIVEPITPQTLLEIYQQSEEDDMRRLALFSRTIYDLIRQGCLAVPPPAVPKKP
jgi:hypothetical protein